MSEQLIYTYSHSVHGKALARLGKAIAGGYGVVGKSRGVNVALEEELVTSAKRGLAPEDLNPGPQYFYQTGFCAGKPQHLFGCTRRVEEGKNAGKYLCHILAMSGEEVQDLWQSGCTLSPAGILLALTMSDFWAQSWEGPAHLLERNAEPSWVSFESALQANQQPAWQCYTGIRETVNLLQEPRFQEVCMLAFPEGTPTQDMLRVLHEALCLRSDLGWCTPVFTHGGAEVTDMKNVMLLGIIGSRMQERATMMGLPVLEVTEKLAARVTSGNVGAAVPPVPPPTPHRRITADVMLTDRSRKEKSGGRHSDASRGGDRRTGGAASTSIASVGKWVVRIVLILVLLGGGYYVWQNSDMVKDEVGSLVQKGKEMAEERKQEEKKETKETKETKEPPRTLSSEDERLLMGYILPKMVGSRLPVCLEQVLQGSAPVRLELGKLGIYPLGDAAGKEISCYELSPGGSFVELSHDEQSECWRLVPTESNGEKGKAILLRLEKGVLRGVTDENGQPVAVLLPVPVDRDQTGSVLLLPEWDPVVTGEASFEKGFAKSFTPQLTPNCFKSDDPAKLHFNRSKVEDALKGARGTVKCTFGNIVLPNAAVNHRFSVVGKEVGDVRDLRLSREPHSEDETFIHCQFQGTCPFDFTDALTRVVAKRANELHGPKARGRRHPASSVAGLFYAVSEVIKQHSENKRRNAIMDYVNMFVNDQFNEFCSSELSHMPMPHESVFGNEGNKSGKKQSPFILLKEHIGNQMQTDPAAMERFESFDFAGVRRYLCEWMGDVAKREFIAQAEKSARDMKCPLRLHLVRVEAPNPDELKWVFECEEVPTDEKSGTKAREK